MLAISNEDVSPPLILIRSVTMREYQGINWNNTDVTLQVFLTTVVKLLTYLIMNGFYMAFFFIEIDFLFINLSFIEWSWQVYHREYGKRI